MANEYYDLFRVSISRKDGDEYNFTGTIETLNIPEGFEKGWSMVTMLDGSTRLKREDNVPITVEFDMYPIDVATGNADSTAGVGVLTATSPFEMFEGKTTFTNGTTSPMSLTGTNTRDDFRVTIALLSDPTALTYSTDSSVIGARIKRYSFANAKWVLCKPDFADKYDKCMVRFWIPPMDQNAKSNYYIDGANPDKDATSRVTALSAYTSTDKGWIEE